MNSSGKNHLNFRIVFLTIIGVFFYSILSQNLYAQDAKKNKIRISVEYNKIMGGDVFFNIKASTKIKRKTRGVDNLDLTIYNELDDKSVLLGTTTTNMDGKSKFSLLNISAIQPDSTDYYKIKVSFEGNDSFKKASKSISFNNADITSEIITENNINYVAATLTESKTNLPIAEESLRVYVQRLFKSLPVNEDFVYTDENGSILVPIEDGIPGVNGKLIIEVVLEEHDDYGTVISLTEAPIGVPFVEDSTFDERTMWSPRNKTPLFLLIFPNLFIIAVWGIIIYLIFNLFKISKSNNKNHEEN